MLEKGSKGTDHLGRVFVDYGNKRVGLNNTWDNKDLENHWVISSYELRNTTEKPTHFPTSQAITKEKDIHSLNSVEPNPTTNVLKTQDLSPLEQANAEKLAKLESERLESGNKIFGFYSDRNITGVGPTQKPPAKQNTILKLAQSQESPLSILEKSQLEKQKKLESGNKIFDFYSNRNFTDFRDARPQPSTSKDSRPLPTTLDEPNLTQKPLTSQENLLKIRENLFITEI